ncbi:DMT family transporter [Hirschia baltica]|uniref:DMT family transporter n=1 Tax=Hirschia baltica (strain ATCC 49814 / DSM 5838 / IFAM 1418) TaxID=582402 RepID=C6XNE2_HIRBI|nr:DMT family transporter [Hirschia baltica]ACT60086.1 protein of unknown function DUF606 [Hirschia baltica ATCC 49814]
MSSAGLTGFFLLAAAFAGGVLVSAQGMVNGKLNQVLGSPIQAAFISFSGGWLILGVMMFLSGHGAPSMTRLSTAPWWALLGGVAGSYMVASTAFGVPRVGVTVWFAVLLAGQLIAALIFDHFGAFGQDVRPVTLEKIAGVVALFGGAWLILKP